MDELFFPTPRLAAWGALALVISGCLVIGFSAPDRSLVKHDVQQDDWRRTANGWERISAWPTFTFDMAPRRPQPTPATPHAQHRFDTHPAVLALLQLVGVLLALVAFGSQSSRNQEDWKSLLARSFRASAFGS